MRTLGNILKSFFKTKKMQYWLRIPKTFDNHKQKELFIMDTLEFLNNSCEVQE